MLLSEPVRGCQAVNSSLHGHLITDSPSCTSFLLKSSSVSYCTCDSDLCNGHLYDYTDIRVKRDKTRVEQNFMFPFAERSDGGRVSGASQDRRIQCYSCGSLFNRDTPSCTEFDRQNETQRTTCKPGEVCLLYEWTKNKSEKGKIWRKL